MTKNITFTADAQLIELAREVARKENTTLNEQFRIWLEQYSRRQKVMQLDDLLADLKGKTSSRGKKFTREQMNERR
jgi:hypothetical protein